MVLVRSSSPSASPSQQGREISLTSRKTCTLVPIHVQHGKSGQERRLQSEGRRPSHPSKTLLSSPFAGGLPAPGLRPPGHGPALSPGVTQKNRRSPVLSVKSPEYLLVNWSGAGHVIFCSSTQLPTVFLLRGDLGGHGSARGGGFSGVAVLSLHAWTPSVPLRVAAFEKARHCNLQRRFAVTGDFAPGNRGRGPSQEPAVLLPASGDQGPASARHVALCDFQMGSLPSRQR